MTAPLVRPIQPGDRREWERLFGAYGEFYETAFDADVLDGVWAWLMDAAHPVSAWVAVAGGEGSAVSAVSSGSAGSSDGPSLVGFAHLRRVDDTFTAGPGWFLDDLFVDPSHRGAGIARRLIAELAAFAGAHGGGTLRWITAASNTTAQRLYDDVATRATWVTYEKET